MSHSIINYSTHSEPEKIRYRLIACLLITACLSLFTQPENAFADSDGLLPAFETCNGLYVVALNSAGTCDSTADCDAQRNCPGAASGCGFHATKKCQDTLDFDCDGAADDVEYPGTDPTASSITQIDTDGDLWVDNCDPDDDNDSVADIDDNCPLVANSTQTDIDNDGIGDACDNTLGPCCNGLPCLMGDINADGDINAADLLLLQQRVLNQRALVACQQNM